MGNTETHLSLFVPLSNEFTADMRLPSMTSALRNNNDNGVSIIGYFNTVSLFIDWLGFYCASRSDEIDTRDQHETDAIYDSTIGTIISATNYHNNKKGFCCEHSRKKTCRSWVSSESFMHLDNHQKKFQRMMTSSNGKIFRVTGHLCGEFTGPCEFPAQRPVARSFDVFLDLRLNKRLSKQS